MLKATSRDSASKEIKDSIAELEKALSKAKQELNELSSTDAVGITKQIKKIEEAEIPRVLRISCEHVMYIKAHMTITLNVCGLCVPAPNENHTQAVIRSGAEGGPLPPARSGTEEVPLPPSHGVLYRLSACATTLLVTRREGTWSLCVTVF